MSDLYLKFANEAEAEGFLFDLIETHVTPEGLPAMPDTEGNYAEDTEIKIEKRQKFLNLDIIGEIYKPTGEMTTVEMPEGGSMEVPVLAKLEGYHANVRQVPGEDTSALEPFIVAPQNPVRVWA